MAVERQPARLMIVEDVPIVAHDLQTKLENLGYTVCANVRSGEEAIAKAAELRPDLILMDIVLSGVLDGIEAAERIRSRREVPVVFTTAHADESRLVRAKLTMPSGYLLKPYQERSLAVTIETALYAARVDAERRRAEEALEEERDFTHEVLQTVAALVVVLDAEGRIVRFNRACEQRTGYRAEEVMGAKVWDRLLIPEEVEKVKAVFAELKAGKRPNEHENHWVARDGSRRLIAWSNTAVVGADGEVEYVIGTGIDVTARRQAEEERLRLEAKMQLAQKLESLGVLAGGIAHDFNNLLLGILGNAELALLDLPPTSPGRDNVKGIQDAAHRATELCQQLLAYSGKGRFAIELIDLSRLVGEMVQLLELSIARAAELELRLAPNLPPVEADATQIRQVVMNLITNASEAIGEQGGTISLTTGTMECDRRYLSETLAAEELAAGDYVFLEVADTGCGMDEETRRRFFDPLFSTKAAGRGLGMAAVRGILRGHQGAIKVASEPGRGTTIRVLLPASKRVAAAPRVEEPAAEWSATGTVLLVDDEETVRTVTGLMLRRLGFEVLTATDGFEAIEVLRQHGDEVTLVLLNMTMPHMDGRQAYRELRRLHGDLPVVVSSGYDAKEAAERFAGQGLAGFIQKPFSLETLREKIRRALRRCARSRRRAGRPGSGPASSPPGRGSRKETSPGARD